MPAECQRYKWPDSFSFSFSFFSAAHANTLTEITSHGTATQTHSHGSGLYPPSHAIDGDLATFNHTESQSPGAAWELHFPSEQAVSSVEIVMRDCCSGRLNGATLRLFDAETEMTYEINIVDGGPLTTFTATIPETVPARDIRIGFEPDQSGIVHLAEVRVFGPAGDPPEILGFSVAPNAISAGQSATLSWEVTGADTVDISGIGTVAASGSMSVSPEESSVYRITATNACDTVAMSASVIVDGVELLPHITEFSAADSTDWVEIWNPSSDALDLTGWFLTDDPLNLQRWAFPNGQVVGAGEFLLVDEPFGLAREAGSYLALVNASGAVVSEFTYPEQFEGSSFGVTIDGEALLFLEPTPGSFNRGPTTQGFLKGVNFSVQRGFYSAPLTLTLSPKTPGATVFFSTDGSDPVTAYTSGIPITTTTVVRATEQLAGHESSLHEAHTYLFVSDVPLQPEFPAGLQTDWLPASAGGALAPIPRRTDYEMDPDVVTSAPFMDREGNDFGMPEALTSLPSLCLTLPTAEMWDPVDGLHANALKRGRNWEREISMEVLDPVAGNHVHTGCGLRIHGGRGRVAEMLKKSFRLYFRSDYGATKFEYPLFDGMPESGVDHLVLRGGNGKTWASPWRDLTGGGNSLPRTTYLRDQFHRDNHRAMGNPAFAGTFVHLYINGIYWGLYNPVERPGGPFAENHFGGNEEDYDFIQWANNLPPQLLSGDLTAWNQLVALVRADAVGNWAAIQDLLDVDSLADYLIANFYVGNQDWVRNNAYGFRPRPPLGDGRFRFMCWDGEECLLSTGQNSTGMKADDTGTELHDHLLGVPEYQLMFADRIHRHLVDEDGVLLPGPATARHDTLVAKIDHAIAAESARWGDLLRPDDPYTHDGDWLSEVENITNNYLTARHTTSFTQMKADGLYPNTVAPVAELVGSNRLNLTAPTGAIWFTTDGSDPMNSGAAVQYSAGATESVLVPQVQWRYIDDDSDLSGTNWTQAAFDDSAWEEGLAPLGYGDISGITLNTIVGFGGDLLNRFVTTYLRHRFQISGVDGLGAVEIRYFRDDGVVIYLNGVEIERSNMPSGAVDAGTLALEPVNGSSEGEIFSVTVPAGLLQNGDNVLAVELHQQGIGSSDLGFDLTMVETASGLLLDGDARIRTRARSSGGEWSALEEETFRILDPAASLVISEIMYHPGEPSAAEIAAGFTDGDDFEYIELRNVGGGPLLLDGIRFTKGVDVTLSGSLAAGEMALVVANRAAFELRYGTTFRILAEWDAEDRLDNGGELIRVRDGDDRIIHEFTYDDGGGWPSSADGVGYSLVLIAPQVAPDPDKVENWRASEGSGGNPGTHDGVMFSGGSDSEFLAYAVEEVIGLEVLPDGRLEMKIRVNGLADDVVGSLEASEDLQNWEDSGSAFVSTEIGDFESPYSTVVYKSVAAVGRGPWSYRFRVIQR